MLRFLERDHDEVDDDLQVCFASFSERDPDEVDDDASFWKEIMTK